jgi:hypothetical protein
MPSTFPLRRGMDDFQLCRKLGDCTGQGSPKALRFLEPISALAFMRSCVTNPEQERNLRLWLKTDEHEPLLENVAKELATGKLIVATLVKEGEGEGKGILRGGSGGSSTQRQQRESTPLEVERARRESVAAEEEAIVLGEEEPEKTWIEIELIDKYGKPVGNERYKLTLPDGSVKWGRLDSDGKARVERLQPGSCQVTFPDRDQEVWEVN